MVTTISLAYSFDLDGSTDLSLKQIALILATFSPLTCQTSLKYCRLVTCLCHDPEMYRSNPPCSNVWHTAHTRLVCGLQCWIFLFLWKCHTELKLFFTSSLLCLICRLKKKSTDLLSQIPLLTDFIIQSAIMQAISFLVEELMMKYGDHSVRNKGCISALEPVMPIRTEADRIKMAKIRCCRIS